MTLTVASTRAPGAAAVASELRVGVLRLARRLRQQRLSTEVSDAQFSVLAVLFGHGPQTLGQLAEREGVRAPSMTRTVAALEVAGLVERSAHPYDRRHVVLDLTEAGRTEVRETRRRRDAWLAVRLAKLAPEQRRVLAEAADILRQVATT